MIQCCAALYLLNCNRSGGCPGGVNIIVDDGIVELWGIVESQIQKDAIRVAVEATPGVRAISDNITVQNRFQNML
jgi:BON domain